MYALYSVVFIIVNCNIPDKINLIATLITKTFLRKIYPTAHGEEDIAHTPIKWQSANQLPPFLIDLKPLHCPHLQSFISLLQVDVSLLQLTDRQDRS